jgi:molybdopterin converting factor small subunit
VKVEVHLFATLSGYLPDETIGDGVALDVPEGSTVADVVRALDIPDTFDCMKVVNGHDASPDHLLADRDVVSLFPPLVGG